MRSLLLVPLALLGLAACTPPAPGDPFAPVITAINSAFAMLPPPPPLTARVASSPSRLTLSNFNYDRARVEAMITPYPDCQVREGPGIRGGSKHPVRPDECGQRPPLLTPVSQQPPALEALAPADDRGPELADPPRLSLRWLLERNESLYLRYLLHLSLSSEMGQ